MLVADILATLSHYPIEAPLPAPEYKPKEGPRVMLAVSSMAQHMSDEGWQLALAFQAGGYTLRGFGLGGTDVAAMLDASVVMVQDEHEWNQCRMAKRAEFFHNAPLLATRPDVFKLTVVKDTHRQYESAKANSVSIGCHAWLTYYNLPVTLRTLSWLRPQHTLRTWHTVDAAVVPPYSEQRESKCLLSGSLGGAYPLRERVAKEGLWNVTRLPHPGYSNTGCSTPAFLTTLSKYKVAICTASKFGYALRKIAEATACGCRVVTDLPVDEVMPVIDGNLTRVEPDIRMRDLGLLIDKLCTEYDPRTQKAWATAAKHRYHYATEGRRVAAEIEKLRLSYGS